MDTSVRNTKFCEIGGRGGAYTRNIYFCWHIDCPQPARLWGLEVGDIDGSIIAGILQY